MDKITLNAIEFESNYNFKQSITRYEVEISLFCKMSEINLIMEWYVNKEDFYIDICDGLCCIKRIQCDLSGSIKSVIYLTLKRV